MLHTSSSIHLHKGANAKASEQGWVSLDSEDGAHTLTIFVHNVEAGRSMIAALETAVTLAAEADLARRVRNTAA